MNAEFHVKFGSYILILKKKPNWLHKFIWKNSSLRTYGLQLSIKLLFFTTEDDIYNMHHVCI